MPDVLIPELAAELKERANALYASKDFSGSLSLYTQIIDQFTEEALLDFLRVIRCNRAACFIELGRYKNAMDDLEHVLENIPQSSNAEGITKKAHLRLARCLFETERYDEAIKELDTYRALVGGQTQDVETRLRAQISEAIVRRDKSRSQQGSTSDGHQSTRPLRYEVKVLSNGSFTEIVKYDQVPISLCSPHAPELPSKTFLAQLATKYDREILGHQAWTCWNCSSPAVGIVHTPASYLHLADPQVVDFAQPVCINGGPCDTEARKMMAEEMNRASGMGRLGII